MGPRLKWGTQKRKPKGQKVGFGKCALHCFGWRFSLCLSWSERCGTAALLFLARLRRRNHGIVKGCHVPSVPRASQSSYSTVSRKPKINPCHLLETQSNPAVARKGMASQLGYAPKESPRSCALAACSGTTRIPKAAKAGVGVVQIETDWRTNQPPRSSSREVGIRLSTFSVVHFRRGTLHKKS